VRKLCFALAIALGTSLTAFAATPAGTNNYADAYKDTMESGKTLVVLVGATWCPACQSMKTSTMPAVAAQGKLDNVAFAYVNTDAEHDLAGKLLAGNMIPQLVRFEKTADGWKQTRLVGGQSVSAVVDFIGVPAKETIAAKQPAASKDATAAKSATTANKDSAVKPSAATTSATASAAATHS
jgi:thiol-disulfide isomerase/thioredoxin